MKVTDLSLTLFNWKSNAWRTGHNAFGGTVKLGIVTVTTDEGVEGHSFLGSSRQGADEFAIPLINLLKPIVIGRNPLDTGAIWEQMWKQRRNVWPRAIGAVDVALWDLAGKIVGQPIFRMLGACRTQVPAYASSAYLPTPEAYGEEALRFKSMGWPAYKMHPHGVEKEDIEICRAVRKAVGDDYTLMLDAMWAFNYEAALRIGRAIEELDFFWYEDPLIEEDIHNYVKLHQKLDIPLLTTEYAPGGLYGMVQWVTQGATDILRGDVAVIGGITPMIRLAHMADAFKMKFEIHHGGNSLNNAANLHVTMACSNCDYYEVFPASGANKYGLVEDIEVDNNGLVHIPEKPGLGYEIDWDLV
ncbi:MAG: mandelate racemase, partial [Bacteroidetes bacterium]|nr:mandelate racemase [Bacteroidota bacterium]